MSFAFDLFDDLVNAREVKQLILIYDKLNSVLNLNDFIKSFSYFLKLKKCLQKSKQILKYNKIHSILQKLEKRSQLKCYHNNRQLSGQRVLVIGGGISGLRVAIELLLLGANVICVEKRVDFSRNNVIHLWPNVITDLRLLAAKRFYGRFCVGSIDHVSIRQIQLILLKIALIFGLKFYPLVTFDKLCPKLLDDVIDCDDRCRCCCHSHGSGDGVVCHFLDSETCEPFEALNNHFFDIIVGSDGRRNTLFQDFPRKEFRGKLAIAITANFVNRRTEAEARVSEISGVSYIYNQKWFKELFSELDIQLENICYYRDETHYFVMTATKQSLLKRKVLIRDLNETHLLLHENNIDREELLRYARDAAQWTSGLTDLEFADNALHSPDVALFDFTSVYAARNASRAKKIRLNCCSRDSQEKYVLMLLTGDSLLEPFWPTGSGAGRGFLSALDAAYTALQWTDKVVRGSQSALYDNMLDVISERESIYRLLAQTTPENINCKEFSLFPQHRYQNWRQNSKFEIKQQVRHLIGHNSQPISEQQTLAAKRARRATVAVTPRDLQDSQSEFEKNKEREELEFELIKRELELKRIEEKDSKSERMQQKSDWLLGSKVTTDDVRRQTAPKKKVDIIVRAQHLEEILSEKPKFEPKLKNVGKIEENDWNFKVWQKNQLFDQKVKNDDKIRVLDNSKAILESRKHQISEKMAEKKTEMKTKSVSKDFIKMIGQELTQRMGGSVEPTTSKCCNCYRCGQQVSAVERISVSGDVLHRSCLRCSKCGISLRLNEFRNELKFLCIYCLKNNSKENSSENWIKKKENFLNEIQKIDFRERIEFENKVDDNQRQTDSQNDTRLQIISKTPINETTVDDSLSSDEELTFDLSSSDSDIDSSDDSDDWQTTEDDESDDTESHNTTVKENHKTEEVATQTTQSSIPSICVETTDDTPGDISVVKYCGSFTEKLFRSKSQPMLAFRRRLKEKPIIDENDDDLCLPFADIGGIGEHFSPVRALKAPIIEFKDI